MRIAVVILAGGEGRRIGGKKPLKWLGNKRLIDHAASLASGWSPMPRVAARDPAQIGNLSLPVLHDEPGVEGPLAGLVAALRFAATCDCEGVLTVPVDMPFLPPDLCARLSAAIGPTGAALAASEGQLHPVCGLWRVSALNSVEAYLATGRRSLMGFAELTGFRTVEWSGDPCDPFFNINRPEDLTSAELRLDS